MNYLLPIIAFLATCIALLGNTYDRERGSTFFKRLTPTGYSAAALAVCTLMLTLFQIRSERALWNDQVLIALEGIYNRTIAIGEDSVALELVAKRNESYDENHEIIVRFAPRFCSKLSESASLLEKRILLWRAVLPPDFINESLSLVEEIYHWNQSLEDKGYPIHLIQIAGENIASRAKSVNQQSCQIANQYSLNLKQNQMALPCDANSVEFRSAAEILEEEEKEQEEFERRAF